MAKRTRKIPPKSEFRDAIILNDSTYNDYLARMRKIALSMFEWVNLPKSCNARYLEMCLYYAGQAALLYDEDYGFINTQAVDAGYINLYGLPTKLNCFSFRFNKERELYVPGSDLPPEEECILVMNNYERVPTSATVSLFALRLAEAQRSADVNIKAQKYPVLIPTDQKQYYTMKRMYEEYDGNSPVIFADKNLIDPSALKAIKTDAPFIANDIMEYQKEIWNQFLTFLGVSNLDEKKERLISMEADSNNELVNLNLQSYLIPRKEACELFNEKFGLTGDNKIDVKVRSDLYNIIKEYESVTRDYNVAKDEAVEIEEKENG